MHYNPSFVNYRPILSEKDKCDLHDLCAKYTLDQFKQDARNYEETLVDFVYTSAKIEGNTYDRVDTDNLLRMGITAGGKKYSDAVMLVNLRNGFEQVMAIASTAILDLDYLCDLHKLLMKDLLPSYEQGIVRTSSVTIGASSYEPLANPQRLRLEVQYIFSQAHKYKDPFEKSIYLHCNLAYLQYFRDGNKRTSRLIQTAALVQANILPLFFSDTLIDKYRRAIIHYYETGDYSYYISFFKENYELFISKRVGKESLLLNKNEIKEFERRISLLPSLENSTGAAYIFWQLTQKAINVNNSARAINWPDIERKTIIESIAYHGQGPNEVGAVICQYSPGAISTEKQQAIWDDIKRLAPDLQAQYNNKQP